MSYLRILIRFLTGVHNIIELLYWLLPAGGGAALLSALFSLLNTSPISIGLFLIGSFLLLLSVLPRVQHLRRLLHLPTRSSVPHIQEIMGRNFENRTVSTDNTIYMNCTFRNCTFRWNGGPFVMQDCTIGGDRRFETQNRTILATVDTLRFLGLLETEFAQSWHREPPEYFQS